MKITLFLLALALFGPSSQPLESSKKQLGDFLLMQDFKQKNIWYYLSTKLELAKDKDGKPDFTLLQMRKVGTAATGTSGHQHFMSLVQLKLKRQRADAADIETLKKTLDMPNIQLLPLPESYAEIQLFLPAHSNKKGRAHTLGRTNDQGAIWTERSFTIRLENFEAQLLQNLLEEDKLAISVAYSFHAEVVNGQVADLLVTGDSTSVDQFESSLSGVETIDTIAQVKPVYANTFSLAPDTKRWPDLIKQIDINETMAPIYAAFELRCYDFTNKLRPDLAMKTVEIEAYGLEGNLISEKLKFLSNNQLEVHQFHFPHPVLMDKPFRYKIKEYNLDGAVSREQSHTSNNWGGVVDITSDLKLLKMKQTDLEIELDLEQMQQAATTEASVAIIYSMNNETHKKTLIFNPLQQIPIQETSIFHQTAKPLQYQVTWKTSSGKTTKSPLRTFKQDHYLFLSPI